MTIDSILTEWQFRLKKGYPTTAADYDILRDVLKEMTTLSEYEQDRIVRRSMGLVEQDDELETSNDVFSDINTFTDFIMNTYAVAGQQIIGLQSMYDQIIKNPEQQQLKNLITSTNSTELKTGVTPIRGINAILYDIIENTIKIPNGDQSELWFAIVFKGKVAGAVAADGGIESDIVVGNDTVSLKNYKDITFDFGSLPAAGTQLLNEFLEIAKLLTNQDISKSKGRDQINNVLEFLDNESIEAQIRQLIQMSENTDIDLIRNIGNRLRKFYSLSDNLDTMIASFCHIVDNTLRDKILSVNWWGMIIKSNRTLFLESSADIYRSVRCTDRNRLSDAIANFHQNKLFVLGSRLSTKVTKKSQD
jgi:hypothetical protein